MLKTLTQIKEEVQKVGNRVFDANSWEFRRGFNMCFEFFSIALSKSTLYHQSILFERIAALEKQLEEKQAGTENLVKVSSAGMIALENTYVATIQLKDRLIEELSTQVHEKNNRINHLENKNTVLENSLKTKKVNKKFKKLTEFIAYYQLEEQFKEFSNHNK